MIEKLIAFGDLHLNWQAAKVTLGFARRESIDFALNLGDEEHEIYPIDIGDPQDHDRLYDELRAYAQESPRRRLVCLISPKTAGVPKDMTSHYVGVVNGKVTGSVVFQEQNVMAAHIGKWILEEQGERIKNYDGTEPLVIFHGHSHSMGVLPEYKWLEDNEFVANLKEAEQIHELKPGKVYWVNPGANLSTNDKGQNIANLAVYDHEKQTVTLRSIPFSNKEIRPTRGSI